jgi:hypothetical protein
MMALTIVGSAPRQMKTLVPSTSSSIECGRGGASGPNRFDDDRNKAFCLYAFMRRAPRLSTPRE